MMEILVKVLACIGGLVFTIVLLINLHDLFERIDALEENDDVRRDDIIEIRDQITRMKEEK